MTGGSRSPASRRTSRGCRRSRMPRAANGRNVALIGRSLWRIDRAARENGYLADVPRFLTEDEAGYVPRDKIVLICTGSQGEPRAALARIARDDHPHIVLEEGDVVIFSSRIIPGNEKAISRLHNALVEAARRGRHGRGPFRPCLRPSVPRRADRDVSDGAAAGRDPGAWRGAAPDRTCRTRAAMPGAAGRRHRKRRCRQARRRRRRDRR